MSTYSPPPIRKHLACVSTGALYGLLAGAGAGELTYYIDVGEGPYEPMLNGLIMGVVCGSFTSAIPIVLTKHGQRFAITVGVAAGVYGVFVALTLFSMISFPEDLLKQRVLMGSAFCLVSTISSSLAAIMLVELISEGRWNSLFHDEMPTVAIVVTAVCGALVFRAILYGEPGLAWCVGVIPGAAVGSRFAVSLLSVYLRKCSR